MDMGLILSVAAYVVFVGAVIYIGVRMHFSTKRLFKAGMAYIEKQIEDNDFFVTRKIAGKSNKDTDAFCHLYIDDTNRKWLLTSPYMPVIGKIHNFSDLADYGFFDEEGKDLSGKLTRGCVNTALFIGTVGIAAAAGQAGKLIGGSATGSRAVGVITGLGAGITAGYFANKLGRKGADAASSLLGLNGASKAYGIILRTKENPELIFDFATMKRDGFKFYKKGDKALANILSALLKLGGQKRNGLWKYHIQLIEQIFDAFEGIAASNQ